MNRIACILICYLIICSSYGQTKFLEITQGGISSRNYIGKQIQNYSQSNIRLLDTTYRSLELEVKDLITLDYGSIIEDLNACPNIIHLKVNYFGGFKRVDYSEVLPFPFDSLKHIEYLQLYAWNANLQDSTIIDRLIDMPSLNYLHMHRGNGFNYQHPKTVELWNKLKGLALVGLYDSVNISNANFQELNVSGKDSLMHLIASNLSSCNKLKTLSISFDSLTHSSAKEISEALNVEHLVIRSKKGTGQVNSILSKLKNLEYLDLSKAKGEDFLDVQSNIKKIKITTHSGKHDEVIKALGKFQKLESLDLRIGRKDSLITADFSPFISLQKLSISGGNLITINQSIGDLKSLKKLSIPYQKLKNLPSSLSKLTELVELNLNGNNLSELPNLGNMKNLQKIELRNNKLEKLPVGIDNLQSLKDLYVTGNYLKSLPENIGNMSALQNLYLYDNYIETLPNSICNLTNLKLLDLGTNCLQELPHGIGRLNSLTELRLFNNKPFYTDKSRERKTKCENKISFIPKSIQNCDNLIILRLSRAGNLDTNNIATILNIPNKKLKVTLRDCNINALPNQGWKHSKLSSIDLSKNNIDELPIELLYSGIDEINLKRNELSIYSQNYDSQNLKALALYGKGIVNKETILKMQGIKETIVKVCSRFYYVKEHNPILTYLPLALEIDPDYVEQNIDTENYAEALLKVGRNEDAINYYTRTIDRQMSSGIKFANAIAINLQNRQKAYLAIGDTISAIADLKQIQSEFNYNMSTQIFSLLLESGEYAKSKTFTDSVVSYYQDLLNKEKEINQGVALSIMEVFLVSDDLISFDRMKREYYRLPWTRTYAEIYKYLIMVREIGDGNYDEANIDNFILRLNNSQFSNSSWSCGLIASWSRQLGTTQRNAVHKLNAAICKN